MAVTNLKQTNTTYKGIAIPELLGNGSIAVTDALATNTTLYPIGTRYVDLTDGILYTRFAIAGTPADFKGVSFASLPVSAETITGVSIAEEVAGATRKTVLTFTDLAVGSAVAAANLAFGKKVFEFPAGVQVIKATYMSVALTGTATIIGDTPEIGLGSVLGAGAQATIGAAGATMEDYWEGGASSAISGATPLVGTKVATAGALTGIALNAVGSVKDLFLNVADGWAGAGDVTATGTITILWEQI